MGGDHPHGPLWGVEGDAPSPPGHMAELGLMLGRCGEGWPRICVPSNTGDQVQPRARFDPSVLWWLQI